MRARGYAVDDLIAGSFRVRRVFGGAGASGMGVVYLVDERDAPEPFVLKACQDGDFSLKEQFKREANVWVSLGGHPNIAKALWVRNLDDHLFVAAEYVSGAETGLGSLADALRAEVAPRQILRWAMQFCSGLAHAIARGLIAHRDIKPANLLLTREGDLKIADFGLGKSMPIDPTSAIHRSVGSTGISGTPPYMAPEQIVGSATDFRCDIYAFGIVLYELCSRGAYPYEVARPRNTSSFADAHIRGSVRPLASPFWPIIERCLNKSPGDRWRSPEELAGAIRSVAAEMRLPCPPFVPPQPVDLSELYAKAQSLTALGRPKEALQSIEQYLDKAPDAFWAWTEKGRILLELDREADAEVATRRSLSLDASNGHAWNNLGLAMNRMGRTEESCGAFDHSLECDPLNGGAMMNAALAHCDLGNHERAETLLCAALELTPEKQTLHFNAGNLVTKMLQARAFGPAEKVSRALVAADATNSQAWHNLGLLLATKGQRKEGLDCVRTAIKYEPGNADTRLYLARMCGEEGLFAEAHSHLDYLISKKKNLDQAVCFKAQLLAHAKRGPDGIALLQNFLRNERNCDSAWFILCHIAEGEGDIPMALQAARECEAILTLRNAPANRENLQWARSKVRELRARLGA